MKPEIKTAGDAVAFIVAAAIMAALWCAAIYGILCFIDWRIVMPDLAMARGLFTIGFLLALLKMK